MGLRSRIGKWLDKLVDKFHGFVDDVNREIDRARERAAQAAGGMGDEPAAPSSETGTDPSAGASSDNPPNSSVTARYQFGLASCWAGTNASKRMMNILSPKMPDSTFKDRLKHMTDRGCTHAHLILANTGDGEAGGYAAWKDSDVGKMRERWQAVKAAGLTPIPWIITDDSAALASDLFNHADSYVRKMSDAGFFSCVPLVVLGLEMDEGYASGGDWGTLRAALRKYYGGLIGVHHKSGNGFPYAKYGDVVLGQLDPGCTKEQVKNQIKAILKAGKRAIGFEYSREPARSLCVAALEAGAEGVGNWDGGSVPGVGATGTDVVGASAQSQTGSGSLPSGTAPTSSPEDGVDASQLSWCYGGFSGKDAKPAGKARIYNLTVNSNGMSYKWIGGGCEDLGASNKEDASCLACLFCLIGGKWVGGKFDWISTSRTTRDFKNIKTSYNGWPKDAVSMASAYAFLIVSKDGRKRTNIIRTGK